MSMDLRLLLWSMRCRPLASCVFPFGYYVQLKKVAYNIIFLETFVFPYIDVIALPRQKIIRVSFVIPCSCQKMKRFKQLQRSLLLRKQTFCVLASTSYTVQVSIDSFLVYFSLTSFFIDCSMPPEFCEFGPKFDKCKPWYVRVSIDISDYLGPDTLQACSKFSRPLSAVER